MTQKKNIIGIAFVALAIAGGLDVVLNLSAGNSEAVIKNDSSKIRVERGRYLVNFGGCNDCHTPKKMTERGPVDDESHRLSGHPAEAKLPPPPVLANTPWFASTAGLTAWSGPWGVTYATNLTPDENTGIGIWTEEMFVKAMRTGKHMGDGRPILPPMPWEGIAKLTDDDLKSVFAYLRSLPPISNRVPDPIAPAGRTLEQ